MASGAPEPGNNSVSATLQSFGGEEECSYSPGAKGLQSLGEVGAMSRMVVGCIGL